MRRIARGIGRWQQVLFIPLFADSWERGTAGSQGLFLTLGLSVAVVVGLLLLVLSFARRCETNSEAARRAWGGGPAPDSVPTARVVSLHRSRRHP